MSDYRIETKCIQSGYEPGNGEPRVLPIYQSTTFKYSSSEQMGRLFDLRNPLFLYQIAKSNERCSRSKNLRSGRRSGCYADIFRSGCKLLCD